MWGGHDVGWSWRRVVMVWGGHGVGWSWRGVVMAWGGNGVGNSKTGKTGLSAANGSPPLRRLFGRLQSFFEGVAQQALNRGDGPRQSLHVSKQCREYKEDWVVFF